MWLLLIPLASLLGTLLFFALRDRPASTRDPMLTIDGYRRMMAALAPTPARPPGDAPSERPVAGVPVASSRAVVPPAREVGEDAGDETPERSVRT